MRKGQGNVAGFIAMIALFILIYILLLPEQEKEKLLQGTSGGGFGDRAPSYSGISGREFRTLLSESPGLVSPFLAEVVDRPLASVNLFSVVDDEDEMLARNIFVSDSLFDSEEKELIFNVNDLGNLESVKLLFFIKKRVGNGNLVIELNGNEIFDGKIETSDLPIELAKSLIGNVNRIKFSVERDKWISTNSYELSDIIVSKEIRSENSREARAFVLGKGERDNLASMTLYFFVNCFTARENGNLQVVLNGKVIHEGLVVCDAGEVSIGINLVELVEGRNVLEFRIDKGRYVLEQVLVQGAIERSNFPGYFFTLQVVDLGAIDSGAHVLMDLLFLDDGLRKAGTIFVNGFPVYIDTFLDREGLDITDFVTDGQNVIKVIPETQFEILNLEVSLA